MNITGLEENQPIRLSGLKPGVCSGLILSGVFYPDSKTGGQTPKFTYFYKYVNELQMDERKTSKPCGIGAAPKKAGVGERR
jgi:hypothetical protein